jgi:hypothetical protein
MNKKIFQSAVVLLFHLLVASYTVFLISTCVVNVVNAQAKRIPPLPSSIEDFRIQTLEERITAIEGLRFDQRLVRIETILDRINDRDWTSNLANGGVGLLLSRALYIAIRRQRGAE